jgi:hypothetical protein
LIILGALAWVLTLVVSILDHKWLLPILALFWPIGTAIAVGGALQCLSNGETFRGPNSRKWQEMERPGSSAQVRKR